MRGFGDLEAVIMQMVWDHDGPVTVRDLFSELSGEREIAYTTVMSTMDNLHRKGWLARTKEGKAYRYTATASREEYSARLMAEALAGGGDTEAVLSHFVAQIDGAGVRGAALGVCCGWPTGGPDERRAAGARLRVVVAWLACRPAARLTARGLSARLGLAAWLAAMASVLISAEPRCCIPGQGGDRGLARAGRGGLPVGHRPGLRAGRVPQRRFELGLSRGRVARRASAAAVLAWRYGRRRATLRQRQTRAHAQAAPIVGRRLPVTSPGGDPAVVLDDPRPAAYCVPGRPGTIVLTSGALAVLDPAQLAAVLAHERAHLAGRHHLRARA